MPANTDFSIRLLAAYNGTFPTSYIVPGNVNDWTLNTTPPYPVWINGVQTISVASAAQHRLLTVANTQIAHSSWSFSSTFMGRGMNNFTGVSELILFPSTISAADQSSLDSSQFAYYW